MPKLGIAGYGYWGKILHNNLKLAGHTNFVIYDPFIENNKTIGDCITIDKNIGRLFSCDYVFVVTPPETHFELCRELLKRGINVWCEKPPTLGLDSTTHLYRLADQNNCNFFVDWTFLFNSLVIQLRDYINKNGYPCSIFMNRMNYGPIRYKVSARYDLSSHDISILQYLCPSTINNIIWKEYDLCGLRQDTSISIIETDDYIAQINSSWSVNKKIRTCYFNFQDSVVVFDDCSKTLEKNNQTTHAISSPIANAIECFLSNNKVFVNKEDLKRITLDTMRILEWK